MVGAKKPMRCFYCGDGIVGTIVQAKRHGWTTWVGGACCQREDCKANHTKAPWSRHPAPDREGSDGR